MTKSTITREQAEDTIEGLQELIIRGVQSVYLDMAIAGMRQLLAAMDREPVFTLEVAREDYKGQKLGNHFGFITLDAARELKEGNYQLYTAQPAPVVPDDVLNRLEREASHITAWHHMDEHSCKVNRRDLLTLVNACRAAMLNGGKS